MRGLWWGAFALALASCGGEADEGAGASACGEELTPCGGDPVGTWELEEMCITGDLDEALGAFDEPECQGAMSGVRFDTTGTYEFRDDGTYEVVGSAEFSMTMTITTSCARALAGDPTLTFTASMCRAMEDSINAGASAPDSSIAAASCSLGGSSCRCSVAGKPLSINESGSYTTDASQIVDSGGAADYCVDGDELTMRSNDIGFDESISGVVRLKKRS